MLCIMTTLDVLIMVVFVGAVAIGFMRGIIVQVGSLAAILFAVLLCRLGGMELAQFLSGHEAPDTFQVVLAKVILFIAGYLSVRVIAGLIKRTTHALQLGIVDRLAGVVFSVFEWMLVLSLALNLWLVIKPDPPVERLSTLANGKAAPAIVELAPKVLGWCISAATE